VVKQFLLILGFVLIFRLPFLHQAIQGDDLYYLYGAEHAQIDPLHPTHTRYLFLGDLVDMRGQSHPPLNSWILGALLALLGDVREAPFHLAYSIFSIAAVAAMWSLARRFSARPVLATLLFCATPAFIVNGNSLESDLPFLAFWLCSVALFVHAVDRESYAALAASAASAGLAALAAYQAIFLTPILAVFLWQKRRAWVAGWAAIFAAPALLAAWQIWERSTSGALPASMLAGYLSAYDFESLKRKTHAAAALIVHLGWIVSPLIVIVAIARSWRWQWVIAAAAALGAAIYNPNPLFWICFASGVWLLAWCFGRGFLGSWVVIFFVCAVAVFFVGSARYLLPLAAPVAILLADAVPAPIAATGFVLQLCLALALAIVNYQHWGAYRDYASQFLRDAASRRVWINGDWGFRWYLESGGALPLAKNQEIQPGEIVVTSELGNPLRPGAPLALLAQAEIAPRLPLRLISLDGQSVYSAGSGLLPFEISTGPIDRIRSAVAVEPRLTYIDPKSAAAAAQIVSGLSPDGWMAGEAKLLLKSPPRPEPLEISFYVPANAPARLLRVLVNGQPAVEKQIPGRGLYSLSVPAPASSPSVTVTLAVDKTFSAPPDARKLGIVIQGIGFP
jgi:hypothetical protein